MLNIEKFYHNTCNTEKIDINLYKIPLIHSGFNDKEINLIWDFYVSSEFFSSKNDSKNIEQFGWKNTQSLTDGFPALEKKIAKNAGIIEFCIIRTKNIKNMLDKMDLGNNRICISHPRAILMQNFVTTIDEKEDVTLSSDESRITAILRHLRNSFAHNRTYFFPNENCLLIDKDGNKITSSILIPKQSLIDWISIISREKI